ncbi:hypothetical protein U9M48_022957 [Paspalum notatum var. saurae]|uniref:Uncharacterized protein n=1 Tax=Paspalum notatum var. saurae TaxID=547442 RepID=A0AAQ3WVG1_PASNO
MAQDENPPGPSQPLPGPAVQLSPSPCFSSSRARRRAARLLLSDAVARTFLATKKAPTSTQQHSTTWPTCVPTRAYAPLAACTQRERAPGAAFAGCAPRVHGADAKDSRPSNLYPDPYLFPFLLVRRRQAKALLSSFPSRPSRRRREGPEGKEKTPNRSCDDEQRRWSGRGGGGGDDLYRDADADADCRNVTPSAADEELQRTHDATACCDPGELRTEDKKPAGSDDTKRRSRSCRKRRCRREPLSGPEKLSEDPDEYDYYDSTPGFGDKLDDDLFFDGRR